jgi:hypothetical protein
VSTKKVKSPEKTEDKNGHQEKEFVIEKEKV